jgi:hypothetical protein
VGVGAHLMRSDLIAKFNERYPNAHRAAVGVDGTHQTTLPGWNENARHPLWVKLRNARSEHLSSEIAPIADVGSDVLKGPRSAMNGHSAMSVLAMPTLHGLSAREQKRGPTIPVGANGECR